MHMQYLRFNTERPIYRVNVRPRSSPEAFAGHPVISSSCQPRPTFLVSCSVGFQARYTDMLKTDVSNGTRNVSLALHKNGTNLTAVVDALLHHVSHCLPKAEYRLAAARQGRTSHAMVKDISRKVFACRVVAHVHVGAVVLRCIIHGADACLA